MGHHASRWNRNVCAATGKRRFRDHREAVAALWAAANSRQTALEFGLHTNRRERRAYACETCRGWHLTSMVERSAA
ncbi:hypothetical protein GCM10027418_07260 [Mariniluteicoccus endophyticus]